MLPHFLCLCQPVKHFRHIPLQDKLDTLTIYICYRIIQIMWCQLIHDTCTKFVKLREKAAAAHRQSVDGVVLELEKQRLRLEQERLTLEEDQKKLRDGERELNRAVRDAGMIDTMHQQSMRLIGDGAENNGSGSTGRFLLAGDVRSMHQYGPLRQLQQQAAQPIPQPPLPYGVGEGGSNSTNIMQTQTSLSSSFSKIPEPVGTFGRDLDNIQRASAERRKRIDEQAQFLRDIGAAK